MSIAIIIFKAKHSLIFVHSKRVKYGFQRDIRVKIDRESGDINLSSYLKVVDTIEEEEEKIPKLTSPPEVLGA